MPTDSNEIQMKPIDLLSILMDTDTHPRIGTDVSRWLEKAPPTEIPHNQRPIDDDVTQTFDFEQLQINRDFPRRSDAFRSQQRCRGVGGWGGCRPQTHKKV